MAFISSMYTICQEIQEIIITFLLHAVLMLLVWNFN